MSTQRRSIALTAPQLKWLQAKAKELGITVAELVRRIIDEKRESTQASVQDAVRRAEFSQQYGPQR